MPCQQNTKHFHFQSGRTFFCCLAILLFCIKFYQLPCSPCSPQCYSILQYPQLLPQHLGAFMVLNNRATQEQSLIIIQTNKPMVGLGGSTSYVKQWTHAGSVVWFGWILCSISLMMVRISTQLQLVYSQDPWHRVSSLAVLVITVLSWNFINMHGGNRSNFICYVLLPISIMTHLGSLCLLNLPLYLSYGVNWCWWRGRWGGFLLLHLLLNSTGGHRRYMDHTLLGFLLLFSFLVFLGRLRDGARIYGTEYVDMDGRWGVCEHVHLRA